MRIAITGANGQLGTALQHTLRDDELLLLDLPEHDITDLPSILRTVGAFHPDTVIHAAAMTDVDGCERNPDLAYRINVLGTRNMAVAAQESGATMVYISTDYVYDGSHSEPYREYDAPNPLSVYGRTKWVGEEITRSLLNRHYIARTAWLYGAGPRNFVKTVLRLARERHELTMVTDEIGSPTFAEDLAVALARLIRQPAYGLYQFPNVGCCSRFDWAAEILRLTGIDAQLHASENYPRAARVPKHVEMVNFFGSEIGITMRPWQEALRVYLQGLGEIA